MIRIILGATTAAAFAVAGLAASPAQAKESPTYTCEKVVNSVPARGFGCEPSNGAILHGSFVGPVILTDRSGSVVLQCVRGFASIPVTVSASGCFDALG